MERHKRWRWLQAGLMTLSISVAVSGLSAQDSLPAGRQTLKLTGLADGETYAVEFLPGTTQLAVRNAGNAPVHIRNLAGEIVKPDAGTLTEIIASLVLLDTKIRADRELFNQVTERKIEALNEAARERVQELVAGKPLDEQVDLITNLASVVLAAGAGDVVGDVSLLGKSNLAGLIVEVVSLASHIGAAFLEADDIDKQIALWAAAEMTSAIVLGRPSVVLDELSYADAMLAKYSNVAGGFTRDDLINTRDFRFPISEVVDLKLRFGLLLETFDLEDVRTVERYYNLAALTFPAVQELSLIHI